MRGQKTVETLARAVGANGEGLMPGSVFTRFKIVVHIRFCLHGGF
jgi:hypothetical protein